MKEYTEILKEHSKEYRNITKDVYKIVKTICRGVNNNRFTLDQALEELNNKRRKGDMSKN